MDISHFRILNNEFPNKDIYVVPEQSPLVILGSKSAVCVDKNVNYTKHIINISRIMHFVRNGEELNIHNTVWSGGGLQLADIGTNNVREDLFNPILGCAMVRLDN